MAMLTDLISYWSLGEASGTRNDSHSTNHLTDTNSNVTQQTGKVGNAAGFAPGPPHTSLNRADNASLSVADIDFTWAFWLYMNNTTGYQAFISKDSSSNAGIEIRRESGFTQPLFLIRQSNGTDCLRLQHAAFGTMSTATWYFILCYHDAVNNQGGILVNTALTTGATSGTPADESATLRFGQNTATTDGELNGRLDEVAFWKRMLTADERTWLYNGGSGRSYADLVATEAPPVVQPTKPIVVNHASHHRASL